LGPSFVGVPSLRRRSVGPRRTDIPVLTALSPHPCGSAHCASSAFSLHPSRDCRCLGWLCMKIKINSFPAEAGPTKEQRVYPDKMASTSTVGPALAGKLGFRVAVAVGAAVAVDRSHAPRGNAASDALRPAIPDLAGLHGLLLSLPRSACECRLGSSASCMRRSGRVYAVFCKSRLAGEDTLPATIRLTGPPRSPASRLLQRGACIRRIGFSREAFAFAVAVAVAFALSCAKSSVTAKRDLGAG
jgi:hypothetical protein